MGTSGGDGPIRGVCGTVLGLFLFLSALQALAGVHEDDLRDHGIAPGSRLYQKTLDVRHSVDAFLLNDLQSLQRGRAARVVRDSEIPRWNGCDVPADQMDHCVKLERLDSINEPSMCANVAIGVKNLLVKRRDSDCMRFACANPAAGFAGGGLCWWHSKFQQRSWQLAVFAPGKARPSAYDMERRLTRLFKAKNVVEFPGVSNWAELTFLYRDLVLHVMLREQFADALRPAVWRQWIKGPVSREKSFRFGRQMEQSLEQGVSVFIYLKDALTAQHAYIAYASERDGDDLRIKILDSNDPLNKVTTLVFKENRAAQSADVFYDELGSGEENLRVPLGFRWASWQPNENGLSMNHLKNAWRKHCENTTQELD